ncbi:MAG: class I SAM-dependent methyltransferase, partial [Spirochaetes bacterium]|nr:class I SAM-dependent methyltransferase [Spirochaetota bacterium]
LSDIINNKINAGVFLDAGCGAGKFLKILKSKSKDKSIEFYGSDFSQSSIEYCINNYKDVEFKISDIYEMEYKDDFADYIVCSEVLEHLIEPEKALNELIRVCKTDGFIFLTVPNGELDDFIGHTNFWSFSEFKKFLEKFELDFELILIENNKSFLAIIKNRKIL